MELPQELDHESDRVSFAEPRGRLLQRRNNLGARGRHLPVMATTGANGLSARPAGPLAQATVLGIHSCWCVIHRIHWTHLVSPGRFLDGDDLERTRLSGGVARADRRPLGS